MDPLTNASVRSGTPAEAAIQRCVDEYGLLGVVSMLRDLHGSDALWEVLIVSDRDNPAPMEPIHG